MTDMALSPYPPGAAMHPSNARWVAWFSRYIDTLDSWRRCQLERRQLESTDARTLRDIGIDPAHRFIAINQPCPIGQARES